MSSPTDIAQDPQVLHGLLQQLPEALVVTDVQGTIRLWNAAAERLFGFSAREALGGSLDIIIPERFKAAHDAGFARAVASGHLRVGGRVMRTRAKHKEEGRKLYVDFCFALVQDPQGKVLGVFATGRDATEAHLKSQA